MPLDVGDRPNKNTDATYSTFTLGQTSTKVKDAGGDFIFLHFRNESPFTVYIKLQAASVDDIIGGDVELTSMGGTWTMPSGQLYTGEISAIAAVDSPVISMSIY